MATTYSSPIGSIIKWKGVLDEDPFANVCADDFGLCLPVVENTDLAFVIDMVGDDFGDVNYASYSTWKVFRCDDCGDSPGANYITPYVYTSGLNIYAVCSDFGGVSLAYLPVDTCFKMCLSATRPTTYEYTAASNPLANDIALAFWINGVRYPFTSGYTCAGTGEADWDGFMARLLVAISASAFTDERYSAGAEIMTFLTTGLTMKLEVSRGVSTVFILFSETATIASFTESVACSNCFVISDDDCFTTKIVYRSDDNCFGINYTDNATMLAFYNKVRIPAYFDNMQLPSEENVYNNSDGTTELISAAYKETWDLQTDLLYPEWIKSIACAIKHDSVVVTNGYAKLTDQAIVSGEKPEITAPFEPYRTIRKLKTTVILTPFDVRNSNCG